MRLSNVRVCLSFAIALWHVKQIICVTTVAPELELRVNLFICMAHKHTHTTHT